MRNVSSFLVILFTAAATPQRPLANLAKLDALTVKSSASTQNILSFTNNHTRSESRYGSEFQQQRCFLYVFLQIAYNNYRIEVKLISYGNFTANSSASGIY
jgi:hypothetical protein